MFTLKVDKEELDAASLVAGNVEIQNVYLTKVELSHDIHPELFESSQVSIQMKLSNRFVGHQLHGNKLFVEIGTRVDLQTKSKRKRDPKCSAVIDVVYRAVYAFPDAEMPEEIKAGLEAFAKINGLYNCWPYLRDEVQRLTSNFAMPVTLPVLRVISKSQSKDQKAKPKSSRVKQKKVKKTKKTKKTKKKAI